MGVVSRPRALAGKNYGRVTRGHARVKSGLGIQIGRFERQKLALSVEKMRTSSWYVTPWRLLWWITDTILGKSF
jgi:hypothetical protein